MRKGRAKKAVAIALLTAAALAAAGCGLGPGDDLGDVSLTVTRDFGVEQVVPTGSDGVTEADTVMRVLERGAEIETRYGGGFVQSIEGLEGDEGGPDGPLDWFFYVNGVESTVGAADYPLQGGEAIWWDYHHWGEAISVPAVVGSWPEPFLDGYGGDRHPVSLLCEGGGDGCAVARGRLAEEGVEISSGEPDDAIRVLVGPWERVGEDVAAARIGRGPQSSGVFADFDAAAVGGCRVQGLGEDGEVARELGPDAGLVAAVRHGEDPPTWVLTGCDEAGVATAARLLDTADLGDRFAVAGEPTGKPVALPLPSG